eukprot:9441686-Alexandrium_andersonii.AAC.1
MIYGALASVGFYAANVGWVSTSGACGRFEFGLLFLLFVLAALGAQASCSCGGAHRTGWRVPRSREPSVLVL